jgi:hypothetical protein
MQHLAGHMCATRRSAMLNCMLTAASMHICRLVWFVLCRRVRDPDAGAVRVHRLVCTWQPNNAMHALRQCISLFPFTCFTIPFSIAAARPLVSCTITHHHLPAFAARQRVCKMLQVHRRITGAGSSVQAVRATSCWCHRGWRLPDRRAGDLFCPPVFALQLRRTLNRRAYRGRHPNLFSAHLALCLQAGDRHDHAAAPQPHLHHPQQRHLRSGGGAPAASFC